MTAPTDHGTPAQPWMGQKVAVRKLTVGGWLVHLPNRFNPNDAVGAFWIRELDDESDARRLADVLNEWAGAGQQGGPG